MKRYLSAILIPLSFFAFPGLAMNNQLQLLIVAAIAVAVLAVARADVAGYLLAFSVIVPSQYIYNITHQTIAKYSLLFLVLSVSGYRAVIGQCRINKMVLFASVFCLMAGAFFYLFSGRSEDIMLPVMLIATTVGFNFVLNADIDQQKLLRVSMHVIFLCVAVTTLREIIFGLCPYPYDVGGRIMSDAEIAIRAKGLFMHPLVLSGFLALFQCFLVQERRHALSLVIAEQILLLFLITLTALRTAIIAVVAVAIINYAISVKDMKVRNVVLGAAGALVVAFMLFGLSHIYNLDAILARLAEKGGSHRIAAYQSAFLIFMNNPIGVGYGGILDALIGLRLQLPPDFSLDVGVMDNAFLTQIAAVGVFGIPIFIAIYLPLITTPMSFRSRATIVSVFVLLCFSFDVCYYSVLNCMLFSVLFSMREIDSGCMDDVHQSR